ncbi:MAG: ABC transporter ATP-binding protein [Chlorobi bacterium]|nr:ABC transporter ATP-binding protein [Chlorobiota bacterium]
MIRTKNLVKTYNQGDIAVTVLSNINLNIEEGEFAGIYGLPGSGKTTLLSILGLVEAPTSGDIYFMGLNTAQKKEKDRVKIRKSNIGYIFEDFNLLDNMTLYENVMLPLIYSPVNKRERVEKVEDILSKLKLIHLKNRYPSQLTGELQQQAAIARALVNKPVMLIADEPTGKLNSKSGEYILNILSMINEEGTTVILGTSAKETAEHCRRIIHIFDGHIINESLL